ncbi:MAG: class I SAM-dependent methyltransferase [Candidatus Omnitrophica bacterium]|nr:class I SAM-dependent methyltransferase [Candidatus Omnitrophota bacterium]MBU1929822.1 class I SAM-dependent methyltransferase [Candidatus Omnitrophota bacterium]MBU2035330.1 class I SAM-dependent methyltransferase [Candidatus Omnitrophota bacterium]MBU2222274.1 class I SAM-dependent methyltransferase [Candidatus Omnitrophota bacterium]MBU2257748.1 class I SAM-dependent methyltransferase [Candidatus Omnitrophota bacterium]
MEIISDRIFWNQLAIKNMTNTRIDKTLGRYKSREFRDIMKKWIPVFKDKLIFKTDLCEEAFGEDEVLFSMSNCGSSIFALDISEEVVMKANIELKRRGLRQSYSVADVKRLPFKDNSFDIILSTSTLDHFNSRTEFLESILELKRCIKPGGAMVIAVNNKWNFNFFLMLKLEKMLGLNRYPVQSYAPGRLKRIVESLGLTVHDCEIIVHVISPLNSVLVLMRKFINEPILDKISQSLIFLSDRVGKILKLKLFTGWFIVLKCVKNN